MNFAKVSHAALAAALALAWCTPVFAGERADGDGEDGAIVVTGQSLEETLPQELSRYGNDMAVVEGTQIRDSGAVDVVKALDSVPGLYIRGRNGPFTYVDVSLQGSRTQDVLWTMDGIRLNNRLYGSTSPNDTLPASMIERIEVLRGGESLFYGTQASAGIINVVTRGFTDDFNGQVNASVDSWGGTSFDGYLRGAAGGHRFVAYASRNRSEGYMPYSAYQPSLTDRRLGYDLWSAGIKYQYDLAPDLALNLQYQHTEAKLDNLSPTRIRESRNDRNEEIASARLDYTGSDTVQFFLKGYFHDWKTAYIQIRNSLPDHDPQVIYPAGTFWGYRDWGGSAVVKLHPHRGLEYLLGYDFQNFSGRDDVLLIAPTSEQVHAAIAQIRTTDEISSKGRIAAGLRHNRTDGARKTIWNVSGRYDFAEALYVEANGGTSFVLPDASQLYGNDPCCETGNPNLKPEHSVNLNASLGGAATLPGVRFGWKATYFNRSITDLIDSTYDDPAYPNGTYINVRDKVRSQGAEAEVTAQLESGWSLAASYTHARVRNEGSSVQRDRNPAQYAKGTLAYSPEGRPFGANLAVNWIGDVWSTASGFGRMNYGNYVLVDLGGHFYVDGEARRNRFGINVENLFDKAYATRGYASAVTDAGALDGSNSRFLYFNRGVPRTLRVSYGLSF
ncbi:TonB-dependent receptor [Novosphingobium sp. ST904]|uniref:TonB-dependent receptor plug domain-containing protein n=1 Tax=Novosphingobium sp. ST904 TaxID=1684385 RepID=UPI0006C85BB8|nr:TonB-dependent receptor [Novosphingobium sp. ST904]KPH66395.1 TonB-dependent receptor [Novosphingobium sp. ST904]TCM30014.1 vitamin B12 transporter [Novosphingobium sp. ST904]